MITIQYQILRYLPDRISGEFVNLGIVVFDASTGILASRFINKIGNISSFFPNTNSRYLIKSVKTIYENLDKISIGLQSEFAFKKFDSLSEITRSVLPQDDSALVFSEVKKTLDISAEATTEDLFSRFVSIHLIEDEDEEVRRDKEVWNKVYKKHFDDNGISSHLSSHKVKTKHDVLEFEKAWKNGAWNYFESVSFNLTRADAIKNKVYKWVGKLDELSSSSESMHIYLLSVLPHSNPELDAFINKTIKAKATKNLKIDLVSENNVTTIVKQIKKAIDNHS